MSAITCVKCSAPAQHIGTSPEGADAFQCTRLGCDHVMLVAVKKEAAA